LKEHEPFVSPELKDSKIVVEALLECLREGDVESFREVLTAHLMTTNKSLIAKKAKLGRRTLYDLMDPTKKFNPELSTVSAIIHALAV
jgi:DNA-binding phage protein